MLNVIFCLRNVFSEPSNSIMNLYHSTLSPDCCHENAQLFYQPGTVDKMLRYDISKRD